MTFARPAFVVLLAVVLVGLTPAAYADPPDPTWMAGYWDDDDFDSVVVYIGGACAIDVRAPVERTPLFVPVARLQPAGIGILPAPLRTAASSRAPPVELSPHS